MNTTASAQAKRKFCASGRLFTPSFGMPNAERKWRKSFPKGMAANLRQPRARGHTHRPCHVALASLSSARFTTRARRGPIRYASHRVTSRALLPEPKLPQHQSMKLATIPNSAEPVRDHRISKRIRHAIDLLVSGQTKYLKDAATQAGLSREHLSRALRKPHIETFVAQCIRRNIAGAQMKASAVLERLMTDGRSEHVKRDAAEYFLGLAGYVVQQNASPSVTVNNVLPGYILDLRTPEEITAGRGPLIEHNPPPRDDEPTAAPVIERTTTAEPSKVLPWHIRPVGRQQPG